MTRRDEVEWKLLAGMFATRSVGLRRAHRQGALCQHCADVEASGAAV